MTGGIFRRPAWATAPAPLREHRARKAPPGPLPAARPLQGREDQA